MMQHFPIKCSVLFSYQADIAHFLMEVSTPSWRASGQQGPGPCTISPDLTLHSAIALLCPLGSAGPCASGGLVAGAK